MTPNPFLKTLLPTLLVAGAAFVSQGAQAQAIARTAVLATSDDGRGGFNASFGDSFTAASAGRSFSDIYTFAHAIAFDAAASVTSSYLNNPLTKDLLITGVSLYRYDPASMAILGTAIAGIHQGGFGAQPLDSWALAGFDLPGGDYAFKVDGRVVGAGGGAFGGDLAIAPIPEAPAWGMLLGGLAVAGTLARWRMKKATRCERVAW